MTLDHLGIAATDAAADLFARLLDATPYKSEVVEAQGVRTIFFGDGGLRGVAPKLELLESTREDSPVARFLASRGPGLHHIAFEVRDLDREMERVRRLGIRLLSDTSQPGADGKQIVFLHPKDTAGVLVELCQTVRPSRETLRIPVRDGLLSAVVSGPTEAPPLVVLHGALGSTDLETDRLVSLWENDFRVYALDFSGHGASTAGVEAPRWATYVEDVTSLLEQADLTEARLFGFSMGGGVALAAAARHPERVTHVASHATNVQWTEADVARMVPPMRRALDDPSGRWASRLAQTHGERWRDLVADLVRFTEHLPQSWIPDDTLRQVRQPALISSGDADRYFDIGATVRLYQTLPNARLWVLPGLDHPIQGIEAASFAATVADHFRETAS